MAEFAADPKLVRQFILSAAAGGQRNLARSIKERFRVSRPTAHNYLRALVSEGVIKRTQPGMYELAHVRHAVFKPAEGLREHEVWNDEIRPLLEGLPQNVINIWHYGCTEMINNVIDHSASDIVSIRVDRTALSTDISVQDHGIGIFRKIASAFGLEDDRHAVLELSKGKVTTDPENHTGEGIFFCSRAFDGYTILSGSVFFTHDVNRQEDWILADEFPHEDVLGTRVAMTLANGSAKSLTDVFDQYATDREEYRFDRTVVPVRLLEYGDDRLVSRSQAKRLLTRFDRFRVVVLDFQNVESIGQAFADEVFRVFTAQHPQVEILALNANEDVTRVIKRATAGA